MWTSYLPSGVSIESVLMPRYSRPAIGATTLPSAPMKKGVAALLLPTRPTSAPRPALGAIRSRKVSSQPRGAPAGVMPVLLPILTVPLAVMCSLSPAFTSMPVSTHWVLPLTLRSRLLLLVALVTKGSAKAARAGRTSPSSAPVIDSKTTRRRDFLTAATSLPGKYNEREIGGAIRLLATIGGGRRAVLRRVIAWQQKLPCFALPGCESGNRPLAAHSQRPTAE